MFGICLILPLVYEICTCIIIFAMNDNYSIVVISDSRGQDLAPLLNSEMDTPIYVEVLRGAKFQDCISVVENTMSNYWVDSFYISMGINNLTHFDVQSRTCTLMYDLPVELTFHLMDTIRSSIGYLNDLFPDLPIVVNSLYGMDLARYHNRGAYDPWEQQVLDTAIDMINGEIIAMNESNSLLTPHISNVVHRYNKVNRRNDTLYHRLRDGLHPSWVTQKHIAHVMARQMHSNIMANYRTSNMVY